MKIKWTNALLQGSATALKPGLVTPAIAPFGRPARVPGLAQCVLDNPRSYESIAGVIGYGKNVGKLGRAGVAQRLGAAEVGCPSAPVSS